MSLPIRWEPYEMPVTPTAPATLPLRRRAPRRRGLLRATVRLLLCAGVGTLTVVGAGNALHRAQGTPDLKLTLAAPGGRQVTLDSATAERRLGFVTVTGNVGNHLPRALARIEAVVELLDAQNHTVQMESGLVALDPVPAGQSAPFRVEVIDDPRAVSYRVRFKKLMGSTLD